MNPFDVNLEYGMLYALACLGFLPVLLVSVLIVAFDVVTINLAPDDSELNSLNLRDGRSANNGPVPLNYAIPSPLRRLRVDYSPPRRKTLVIAAVPFLLYATITVPYIFAFNQPHATTIHFVDSVTGQPVTDPLNIEAFDYAGDAPIYDSDRCSPPVDVTRAQSGVLRVKWYHGESFYIWFSENAPPICVRGYGTWTTFLDDYPSEIWAVVTRPPATNPAMPATAPSTGPLSGHR